MFIGSSLAFAFQARQAPLLTALRDTDDLPLSLGIVDIVEPEVLALPQLYLSPENPLMWALLIVLWSLLSLDAARQFFHPSESGQLSATFSQTEVWPLLSLALVAGAVWPWMMNSAAIPVISGAIFMMFATISVAARGRNSRRPALGFLAGWATAICIASVAAWIAHRLSLSVAQTASMAILPGALVGLAAQEWIGPSIAFPAALIWAFCAIAITTMSASPMIALAAIIAISATAIVLIRAAS